MDHCGIREEHAGSCESDHSIVINGWDRGERPGCLQTEQQQMSHSQWLLWENLLWMFLELSVSHPGSHFKHRKHVLGHTCSWVNQRWVTRKNQSTDGKSQFGEVMLDNANKTILHFYGHFAGKKKDPDPGDAETPMACQSNWVGQEISSHTTHL